MRKAVLTVLACALPISTALAGGTFLGKDPEGDKKAAKDQAFGEHSAADENRDATITKDEWSAYLANNRSAPSFEKMDKNGDGKITTDEKDSSAQGPADSSGAATGGSDGTGAQP